MLMNACDSGWLRIDSGLDVECQHGIPVRISNTDTAHKLDETAISKKIHELTGFTVSMHDWININAGEQQWSVCIDKTEFEEVLHCLALSSAAMFVDRFHKVIDASAVDWDEAEYNYDFNHAIEHCCIPYGTINKSDYFSNYIKTMHEESARLINEGVSPLVEAE
ncbi:MAG: hypothetical protein ACNYZG_11530 [Gammaproteobacteria bacterium]